MADSNLEIELEAILFTSSEPYAAVQLSRLTSQPEEAVSAALARLSARLTGGIRLAESGGTFRLVTAPEAAAAVRKFLQDTSRQDLSRPALETLSIIAYKGPLTKSQVEDIRGVSSDAMIRNLLARALIVEAGRSPEPGRPQLYAVSHAFLSHFGLTSTQDLPPLPETNHED